MPYNEQLADRIREALKDQPNATEMKMMGGLCFMVDDKMCLGVTNDDLMVRLDPAQKDEALERPGCREMDFTGRPMKAFVFVDETGTNRPDDFQYWVDAALAYNKIAPASKKKKKKG